MMWHNYCGPIQFLSMNLQNNLAIFNFPKNLYSLQECARKDKGLKSSGFYFIVSTITCGKQELRMFSPKQQTYFKRSSGE